MLTGTLSGPQRRISVDPEYQAGGVWTGLRGSDAERIERNLGSATVVPLSPLPDNLSAWIGYQEVWDLEVGRAPYAFRQASLTVHVGEVGDPVKPQLLRLEWPGLRDWDRNGVGFQSPGAGHPHWQVDLLESLAALREPALFDPESEEGVEDFALVVATPSLSERLGRLTIERMHLASAAPWWAAKPGQFGAHQLNAPANLDELTRWLSAAVSYLSQEIARCSLRP